MPWASVAAVAQRPVPNHPHLHNTRTPCPTVHAVLLLRLVWGDVAVDDVFLDTGGVAVGGVAVASGACYVVGDGVAVGDGEGGALAVAGVAVALRVDYVDAGGGASVASQQAEGGRLGALAADGGGRGMAHHAPYATHSAASAVLACAPAVGDDFVLVDLYWEAHLQLFHGRVHVLLMPAFTALMPS